MITLDQLFKRDYGSAKIGVFGCGCWFYWDQFPGLKDKLVGHQTVLENRLKEHGVNVISGGLSYALSASIMASAALVSASNSS